MIGEPSGCLAQSPEPLKALADPPNAPIQATHSSANPYGPLA